VHPIAGLGCGVQPAVVSGTLLLQGQLRGEEQTGGRRSGRLMKECRCCFIAMSMGATAKVAEDQRVVAMLAADSECLNREARESLT
jgi:hypothetical protein